MYLDIRTSYLYVKVNVLKPVTSKATNSESYLVCRRYKGRPSVSKKHWEQLINHHGKLQAQIMGIVDSLCSTEINLKLMINLIFINLTLWLQYVAIYCLVYR